MFAALLSSLISEYQLRTEVAQKLGGILDTFYSWETKKPSYTIIYWIKTETRTRSQN